MEDNAVETCFSLPVIHFLLFCDQNVSYILRPCGSVSHSCPFQFIKVVQYRHYNYQFKVSAWPTPGNIIEMKPGILLY